VNQQCMHAVAFTIVQRILANLKKDDGDDDDAEVGTGPSVV